MSAPVIKPVDLKTGSQGFRPLAMPRWTPPGQQAIFNEKRMGQKKLGASGTNEFVNSIGLGVVSAAGVFIGSKFLPSIWGVGLIGGGLIGLGISLNGLFPSKESAGGVVPEGINNKIPDQADFDMIFGKFEKPRMYEKASGYGLSKSVDLLLSNTSKKDVTINLTIKKYEDTNRSSSATSAPFFEYNGNVFSGAVMVPAEGTVHVPEFSVGKAFFGYVGNATKLVAEKQRSAGGSPVKIAEVIYF